MFNLLNSNAEFDFQIFRAWVLAHITDLVIILLLIIIVFCLFDLMHRKK